MERKIGGHVSVAGGLLNAINNTQTIGGNCMQFFAGSPRSWARSLYDEKIAQEFVDEVKEENLNPVFIHALYLINLAAESASTLENSLKSLEMDLRNSVSIGAEGVIVHIGSYTTRSFDQVASDLVTRIEVLLDKVPGATLILENSAGQKGKIGTLEELGFLMKELKGKRVKICLDTAHLFAAGYDISKREGVDAVVADVKKNKLEEHLVCLHLNDSTTKCNSRHDVHANLGEGEIGLEGLKNIVNATVFINLPLILEVPGDENSKVKGPDRKNIDIARSLII